MNSVEDARDTHLTHFPLEADRDDTCHISGTRGEVRSTAAESAVFIIISGD